METIGRESRYFAFQQRALFWAVVGLLAGFVVMVIVKLILAAAGKEQLVQAKPRAKTLETLNHVKSLRTFKNL